MVTREDLAIVKTSIIDRNDKTSKHANEYSSIQVRLVFAKSRMWYSSHENDERFFHKWINT